MDAKHAPAELTEAHPTLLEYRERLGHAFEAYRQVLRQVQAECPHDKVVETPIQYSEYFPPMQPARICVQCRKEEHARYGFPGDLVAAGLIYPDPPPGTRSTLNTKYVRSVDRDTFYKFRFPK